MMELKSIVNSDIVNLINCDSEPIHIPGSIQPHGFLLALNDAQIIKFVSGNVSEYGFVLEKILDEGIENVLGTDEGRKLSEYLKTSVFDAAKPHTAIYNRQRFNVNVHRSKEYTILEFEPLPDEAFAIADLYLQTKKFTEILSGAIGPKQLCQQISEEVKLITGYDRVMIYKFDEGYNGEVFAEARNEELEPFLGLHYPHTDIPVQARELYIRNLMRMIVDVNYKPVSIYTFNQDATNQHLDLSHSVLRSVSPIHIEYLKNMGVSGTLTISLLLEGKLWGLIACHHYSPKNISYDVRIAVLLQGHFLSSQIRVQTTAEDYNQKLLLDKKLKIFLQKLEEYSSDFEESFIGQELIDVTNSNGVCVVTENSRRSFGDVPESTQIEALVKIFTAEKREFVASSNISCDFTLQFANQVAGLLYYRLDSHTHIIWFRNELKKEINWAGDPAKSIEKDESGLSPRKSFAIWKEVVANHSNEWRNSEKDIADECVYAIQKHYSYIRSKRIQEIQARLLRKLQIANEELENINWIGTHDLKEPLRKIRVFASMLLGVEKVRSEINAVYYINRMSSAADRMQKLLDDLLAFSRIRDTHYSFELVSLNPIMDAVIQENLDAINEKNINVKKDALPEIYCIPFLIKQLFCNLITNSIKYSNPGSKAEIIITCRKTESDRYNGYDLIIADNGKGFDSTYSELIFKLFQRLDKNQEIEGTGIGLAICRKVVDIHKGKIKGEGILNKGAIFTVMLPYNPLELEE